MTAPFRALVVLALAIVTTQSAAAQNSARHGAPARPAERAQLERQYRQRLARAVQDRLHLTDAQMARLQKTNATYEGRRRALVAEERQLRAAIASQFAAGDTADQAAVAKALDRVIAIQRERLDLVEKEQRELSTYLTPVQRARYLVLQDRLRRRVDELQRGQQRHGGNARRSPPGER